MTNIRAAAEAALKAAQRAEQRREAERVRTSQQWHRERLYAFACSRFKELRTPLGEVAYLPREGEQHDLLALPEHEIALGCLYKDDGEEYFAIPCHEAEIGFTAYEDQRVVIEHALDFAKVPSC